jgi:23S rRNA (pseudouridine1915-N3)-methyltransferase
MSSARFATNLVSHLRTHKNLCFLIGGADGLSEGIRMRTDLLVSFGKMTWPHMLVRGLLAEQIYRATLILNNHPYHRE